MSQTPDHDPHPGDDGHAHADEEYGMPCAEALLAGTLALMTGHAQACCAHQRERLAHKAAENLALLARHPRLSPGFRAMALNLQSRWQPADLDAPHASAEDGAQATHHQTGVAGSDTGRGAASPVQPTAVLTDSSRALWHKTPEVIQ